MKPAEPHTRAERPILIVSAGNTFNEIRARHGDFDDWIADGLGGGAPVARMDARDQGARFPAPNTLAGIVVTGSHAMVTDHAPWSERLAVWLRHCIDAGVPVLGICYGHQLMAYAMGGRVGYNPRGMEIGTHDIALCRHAAEDDLFRHLPQTFPAQLVHAQSVLELPPGATLLAGNAHEPHQAFRLGRTAWGVQFHPEFSAATMRAYMEAMASRQSLPQSALGSLRNVSDTPQAKSILRRFADISVREPGHCPPRATTAVGGVCPPDRPMQ